MGGEWGFWDMMKRKGWDRIELGIFVVTGRLMELSSTKQSVRAA